MSLSKSLSKSSSIPSSKLCHHHPKVKSTWHIVLSRVVAVACVHHALAPIQHVRMHSLSWPRTSRAQQLTAQHAGLAGYPIAAGGRQHAAGCSVDLDVDLAVGMPNHDAAELHGCWVSGRSCGRWGRAACCLADLEPDRPRSPRRLPARR